VVASPTPPRSVAPELISQEADQDAEHSAVAAVDNESDGDAVTHQLDERPSAQQQQQRDAPSRPWGARTVRPRRAGVKPEKRRLDPFPRHRRDPSAPHRTGPAPPGDHEPKPGLPLSLSLVSKGLSHVCMDRDQRPH
jgi:hypothetical protein